MTDFNSDLTRSVIQPIVLHLVSERPMYGYEMIKIVNQRTQNEFQWKEGTLYPCLHRMAAAGLIKSDWQKAPGERQRKYYSVTRKGTALAETRAGQWTRFAAAVNAVLLTPQEATA